MRYRIVHRTAYTYASPVHESFNEVRLRPLSDESQTCLSFELSIDPPATVSTFPDYYGNAVHNFGVPYLHDRLEIEAMSEVVTFAAADQPIAGPRDGGPDRSPPLSGLAADPALADEHAEFLNPSAYAVLEPASSALSRELPADDPATTALAYFRHAGEYIHDRFQYQVGATNVHSTVAQVIEGGRGVCQDFAHLLISLCRHAGLPARYVSGYLGDVAHSTASHAWAEAYIPPYGWVGYDATLGSYCTGRHIKIGMGRDYADVAVVRGTYKGGGAATLEVSVSGMVLGSAQELSAARTSSAERGRGKLIQYQTLGSMKQLQRLGAMTQSMGGMTQTLGDPPSGIPSLYDEPEVPRQQPQQQQQRGERGKATGQRDKASGERGDGGGR